MVEARFQLGPAMKLPFTGEATPPGRGSDGVIDNTRLQIRAATVRERSYA